MPNTLATDRSKLDRFILAAILILVFWAPLPLGSNRDWSVGLLIMMISFISLLWGISLFRNPRFHVKSMKPALIMFGLLVFTQLWVATQFTFNLSERPGATFQYLMLGISYCLLFIMVVGMFNTRKRLNWLLGVLLVSGAFQAFWGASMVLSGVEWLFGVPKEHYLGKATGTFVNRNHLAGYLEMTMALSIGLMLALRDGKKFTWINTLELIMSNKVLIRLAVVVMVIGLVMTQSRMGNTAFVASLIIVGTLFVFTFKEHRKRNIAILISFIIIDILVISQYFGLENLKNRLVNTEVSVSQDNGQLVIDINDLRGIAFTNSIPLAQERTFVGHGAGSYEVVFISHAGPQFGGRFDHAHNDYIQFWVEYGLIGSIPLLLFALLALYNAYKAFSNQRSRYRSGIGFGAMMAIIAIMIHSFTDFNLQIPANAMTFTLVCAIAVLANTHRHVKVKRSADF